jgi:hypothetical protein
MQHQNAAIGVSTRAFLRHDACEQALIHEENKNNFHDNVSSHCVMMLQPDNESMSKIKMEAMIRVS